MTERIIISMTTWNKRIDNIPYVLDTIFAQTLPPDLVVMNLAYNEEIPVRIQKYIEQHSIEINRVPDTKVYKKLLPTLKKYPNDCIISIDDDWLYPEGMIKDFIDIHKLYPNNPISGNRAVNCECQCHCGCASLQKACFFGDYLDVIDDEIIQNCPSDDAVYTYFSNKAGFPYIRTNGLYYINMQPFNNVNSYSEVYVDGGGVIASFEYLIKRFGSLPQFVSSYIKEDKYITDIIYDICISSIKNKSDIARKQGRKDIYSTRSYIIGNYIMQPLSWFKNRLVRKHNNV